MVFDPYFFVAKKPSSKKTCTIVNIDNLQVSFYSCRSILNSVVWYLKISHGRKASSLEEKASSLFCIKSCFNPCCGLAVIFCGFVLHLIGHETINISEIFSGVHNFTGKTVKARTKEKCYKK